MLEFILDTSGEIVGPTPDESGPLWIKTWSDLDPFTQGYTEALFASLFSKSRVPWPLGFSDLAPETLARIIADCTKHQTGPRPWVNTAVAGAAWWADRRNGHWVSDAGPLGTPYLGDDDGKVYLREAA